MQILLWGFDLRTHCGARLAGANANAGLGWQPEMRVEAEAMNFAELESVKLVSGLKQKARWH